MAADEPSSGASTLPSSSAEEPAALSPESSDALSSILEGSTTASSSAPSATEAQPATTTEAQLSAPTAESESADLPVIPVLKPASDASTLSNTTPPPHAAQLEEIVVTATKREESLREIPSSITSLSAADLEQRNIQGVQDIAKSVPGVNYSESGDGPPTISIRGISPQPATSFTTGVLFGDVSFSDDYVPLVSLDPNPFDLDSVEVLKGPQGTLFGASALNGAIRYVPTQPKLSEWQVKYFGAYSRLGDSMFRPDYGAAVNAPIGDNAAIRLTGFKRQAPGYVDNLKLGIKASNSIQQNGVRGIARWQPLEPLDISLTYASQSTHIADASTTDNLDGNLSSNVRPRLSPQSNGYNLTDLKFGYDFDWARLVSESAYVRKRMNNFFDGSSRLPGTLPIIAQMYQGNSTAWSQELRLVSPTDSESNWQWVTGLYWTRQRIHSQLDIELGNDSIPLATVLPILDQLLPGLGLAAPDGQLDGFRDVSDVVVNEKALFGDVTRRFWEVLELTLGGRLYDTSSGGTNTQSGVLITALRLSPSTQQKATVGERAFNPHASLSWHFTPEDMSYIAVSKGFRVGGVQPGAAFLPTDTVPIEFHSDTIWNYEGGVRTQWLDNTLHLDITGFYERWSNPQYLQPDSTGLLSFISNVGGVKSQGGEVALQWLLPFGGLMLNATAAYTDTVTTKPFTATGGKNVPVGARWPFSSQWQTATTLAQVIAIGNFEIKPAVTHLFIGKAVNNLTQQASILGYQEWDLNCSVSNSELWWMPTLSLNINNLFDARGVMNHVFSGNSLQSYSDVLYEKPRGVTLRISGSF